RRRAGLRVVGPSAARALAGGWTLPAGARGLRPGRGPVAWRPRALAARRPRRRHRRAGGGARWSAGRVPRTGHARAQRNLRLGHAPLGARRPRDGLTGGADPLRRAGGPPRARRGGPAVPSTP